MLVSINFLIFIDRLDSKQQQRSALDLSKNTSQSAGSSYGSIGAIFWKSYLGDYHLLLESIENKKLAIIVSGSLTVAIIHFFTIYFSLLGRVLASLLRIKDAITRSPNAPEGHWITSFEEEVGLICESAHFQ